MSRFKKCGSGCGRTLTPKNVRRVRVLDEGGDGVLGDVARDNRNMFKRKGMTGLEGWARVNRQHMRYICSDCFALIKNDDERTLDTRKEELDSLGLDIIEPKNVRVIHNPKQDYTYV